LPTEMGTDGTFVALKYHMLCLIVCDCRWLPMPEGDPYSKVIPDVPNFAACVELCNYDPCQFVTYDYIAQTCTTRNATRPTYTG
jgi:hypothetical protein